jgi:hypothetical protein
VVARQRPSDERQRERGEKTDDLPTRHVLTFEPARARAVLRRHRYEPYGPISRRQPGRRLQRPARRPRSAPLRRAHDGQVRADERHGPQHESDHPPDRGPQVVAGHRRCDVSKQERAQQAGERSHLVGHWLSERRWPRRFVEVVGSGPTTRSVFGIGSARHGCLRRPRSGLRSAVDGKIGGCSRSGPTPPWHPHEGQARSRGRHHEQHATDHQRERVLQVVSRQRPSDVRQEQRDEKTDDLHPVRRPIAVLTIESAARGSVGGAWSNSSARSAALISPPRRGRHHRHGWRLRAAVGARSQGETRPHYGPGPPPLRGPGRGQGEGNQERPVSHGGDNQSGHERETILRGGHHRDGGHDGRHAPADGPRPVDIPMEERASGRTSHGSVPASGRKQPDPNHERGARIGPEDGSLRAQPP